ncbi:O-antigen ligase family protein [bacterium]|nr:O-antigen ligase family protein [bacterium]
MTASVDSAADKLLAIFFALFLFSATFSIAVSQVTLGIAAALFLWVSVSRRVSPFVPELRVVHVAFAVWVAWLFFTCLLGETPLRSLRLSREEWLFSAVLIATLLFSNRRLGVRLMAVLASGAILVSLYALFQYLTGMNLFTRHEMYAAPGFGYRAIGMFTHVLTFGNFFAVLACTLIAFTIGYHRRLSGRLRLLFVTASLCAAGATFLSFSRGPIAALVGTIILLLLILGRRYWKASAVVLAVLVVGVAVVPGVGDRFVNEFGIEWRGEYEGSRMFIWRNSVKVIEERPLVGVGMGNFKTHYERYLRPDIESSRKLTHAHNDLLNVSSIAGIPGAVIFVAMWLVAMWFFWRGYRVTRDTGDGEAGWYLAALAGSICFFGTSLVEATWVDEEVRQLLMVVWGVGLSGWYVRKKEGNRSIESV